MSEEAKVTYEVSAFDLVKLTPDGKAALPWQPAQVATFPTLDGAEQDFADKAKRFERAFLMQVTAGTPPQPKLHKRAIDGHVESADQIVRR